MRPTGYHPGGAGGSVPLTACSARMDQIKAPKRLKIAPTMDPTALPVAAEPDIRKSIMVSPSALVILVVHNDSLRKEFNGGCYPLFTASCPIDRRRAEFCYCKRCVMQSYP